ncbi:MAG: 3-phosphoshikimate 1-carboxyvinyltransferase [Peptococcaceae bacterium]|jgi:3-phosphoshikimate 1-carboxyvinyltransferase|nr:3-phosphoshikimate 1-carboxyvinyltransferase [Peptococcaceae bacterium]
MRVTITQTKKMEGTIQVPGDKSISHRSIMLGALAQGVTQVEGFLMAEDCLSTVRCFRALGVPITMEGKNVRVEGRGLYGLQEPEDVLDVGNSGTTIRLMMGILAGQPFTSFLTGDPSIRRRPMGRVAKPLREMGATILGRQNGNLAPLAVQGGNLRSLSYQTPVASAQIKSSILLAGLYADGWTEVIEPEQSRNHSELMLKAFGAELETDGLAVRIKGGTQLKGQKVLVPGDISSAAFFLVAGLIVPQAKIIIENVGLNPTRDGIIEVLQAMGGKIRLFDTRVVAGELIGNIEIQSSELRGVSIGGAIIPRLIDEIPVLAVAAAFAEGVTEIHDAAELKVKESNRLYAISEGLTRLGAQIEELPDGLRIIGGKPLKGNVCQSYHDHRIAMALAVAGLRAEGETHIEDGEAVNISFPEFTQLISQLQKV